LHLGVEFFQALGPVALSIPVGNHLGVQPPDFLLHQARGVYRADVLVEDLLIRVVEPLQVEVRRAAHHQPGERHEDHR